jgi:biopolymer transport protein TolR
MGMGQLPSQRRHGRRAPMAEINVTPMVDVMLVLLIIFMVTAPLLNAGVPIELPDSKAAALDQTPDEPVQVSLDSEGRLFIDDQQIPENNLAERLVVIAAKGSDPAGPQIYLRADRDIDYGRVMKVMGELNHAGLRKIALVTTGAPTGGTAAE